MKHMKKILIGLLALCMAVSICACDGASGDPEDTKSTDTKTETTADTEKETEAETEKKAAFEVKVVDENGAPVAGVMLQVCKDTCVPSRTGDDGVASFNVEITDGYKLSVLSCPTGYEYTGEAEVYLESGATEITVEVKGVE